MTERAAPPLSIEGHAIVSSDGMISDAAGDMPQALRNEADWQLFQAALDRARLVVLGRLGHTRHPNPGRRRLVVTGSITGLRSDPHDPLTTFWNPADTNFDEVLDRLGIAGGTIAITGGTRVFDLFASRFDLFYLATATRVTIPGGRPCFTARTPGEALRRAGLSADPPQDLDAGAGVTLTLWRRA